MLKIRLLFGLFLLLAGTGLKTFSAKIPDLQEARHFLIQHWTSREGLPVNSVQAMAQTPDGFIWMATQEGLVRFDGSEFTTFSKINTPAFLSDDIYSLLLCRDGSLLIGCHAGHLIRYNNHVFTLLTHPELYGGKNVTALCEDSENGYWIGTFGGGLGHFQSQTRFSFLRNTDGLPGNIINAMIPDEEGGLWIGTQDGLSRYSNGKFKNFTKKDGLTDDYILSLCLDHQKRLWIGTNNGGINLYRDGKFVKAGQGYLKKNLPIRAIVEDHSGTIWIGSMGEGIYSFRDDAGQKLSTENGLSGNNILCLLAGKDKNLWAGTSDAGFNLISPRLIDVFTTKDGLSDNIILPVYRDPGGGIWAGNAKGGLDYFFNGRFEQFQKKLKLPSIPLITITRDKEGGLWAGTAGAGLFSYRNGSVKQYTTQNGLRSNMINAVYTARDSVLWAGTNGGGVSRFEKDRFITLTSKEGLSHDQVNCLIQDRKGRMWIGTNGGGINRLDPGKITWITSENGLPDDEVLTMYEDREGTVWVGCSHNGLAMIRGDSIEVFNTEDGLCEDKILQILEDSKGNLWMSGSHGIFSVAKTELLDLAAQKISKVHTSFYGTGDGMLSAECSGRVFPAGCIGDDDHLWFPTLNGLARVDANLRQKDSVFLGVCLTRVFINDLEVNTDQTIELEPGTVNLEIQYTCPEYNFHQAFSFKYILEGFDFYWTKAGTRKSAFYTHLPPGKYEFLAAVEGPFSVEGKPVSLLKLNILPYFYQTAWFFALCIIAAAGFFWFVVRYQYRKIKEKQLNRMVDERTRELRHEISRREMAQKELMDAKEKVEQSDRMKSSLLSFLNQDFRTPVNSIMGFSEMLMQEPPSDNDPGISQYIHESGKRLLDTLDSAMLLAQLDQGKEMPSGLQDLLPVIEAALKPMQKLPESGPTPEQFPSESQVSLQKKAGPYLILLVEDNEINVALIKSYLGKDYEIDVAMEGEAAIEKAIQKQYDAILMDINLGKGMDGLTATQRIRNLPGYPSTPIIAVTGYTMAGMQERIIEGGCSYYLAKPFGKKLLVDLLITVLPEKKTPE